MDTRLLVPLFILAGLIFIVALRKTGSKFHTKLDLEGFWKENKDTMTSLGQITLALILFNWICSSYNWWWWLALWNGGPFLLTQFAILFFVYMIWKAKKKIAKAFGFILLAAVLVGWAIRAWPLRPGTLSAPIAAAAKVEPIAVKVPKGDAMEFEYARIASVDDVPVYFRARGSGTWRYCGKGEKFGLDPDAQYVEFKAIEDFYVRVYR